MLGYKPRIAQQRAPLTTNRLSPCRHWGDHLWVVCQGEINQPLKRGRVCKGKGRGCKGKGMQGEGNARGRECKGKGNARGEEEYERGRECKGKRRVCTRGRERKGKRRVCKRKRVQGRELSPCRRCRGQQECWRGLPDQTPQSSGGSGRLGKGRGGGAWKHSAATVKK